MNTETDKSLRALRLFSKYALRENFNAESNLLDLILDEIIKSHRAADIKRIVTENIALTKQHIYIFRHRIRDFTSVVKSINEYAPFSNGVHRNSYRVNYLLEVPFSAVLTNPLEYSEIIFLWPVSLIFRERYLIIKCTILEKKINSYYPDNRNVVESTRLLTEEDFIANIKRNLVPLGGITECDLNRGLKHLWDHDLIDSKYVKWRKTRSISTETMDQAYTLKTQYPEEYNKIIQAPLSRTVFKVLQDEERYCEVFSSEPDEGRLSITRYPKNDEQVDNLIAEILEHN